MKLPIKSRDIAIQKEKQVNLAVKIKKITNTKIISEDLSKDIAEDISDVSANKKAGYTYCITSPVLNAIKIGYWTSTLQKLRCRYITPYGRNLQIIYVESNDAYYLEQLCHRRFKKFNITNELFEKKYLDEYKKYLEDNKDILHIHLANEKFDIESNIDRTVFFRKIIESDDIDVDEYDYIAHKIKNNTSTEKEKFSLKKFEIKQFWKVVVIDIPFLETHFRKEKNVVMLKYLLNGVYDIGYMDNVTNDKCDIIRDMIKVLGFDLTDLDLKLDIKTFMKNTNKLLTGSGFSKNYNKIRILFDKSKKSLNTTLTGKNLVAHINCYLSDCCLSIVILPSKIYDKKLKKRVANSKYQLYILDEFKGYID